MNKYQTKREEAIEKFEIRVKELEHKEEKQQKLLKKQADEAEELTKVFQIS